MEHHGSVIKAEGLKKFPSFSSDFTQKKPAAHLIIEEILFGSRGFQGHAAVRFKEYGKNTAHFLSVKHAKDMQLVLNGLGQFVKIRVKIIFLLLGVGAAQEHAPVLRSAGFPSFFHVLSACLL